MKNILIVSILLFTFFWGCKRDERIQRKNLILAGEKGSGMTYRDFNPDIVVKADSINDHTTVNIDINNDGKKDFSVYTYYSLKSISLIIKLQNDSANQMEICSFKDAQYGWSISWSSTYYDGSLFKLNLNETITQSKYWTFKGGRGGYNNSFGLNITDDYSLNKDYYIGIRFIENGDTLYGWVRLSLKGNSEVVLYDCAYQTK
ncbi:MAG: hypothetical protein ACOYMA_11640 [Bacteroidia bacterium]